MNFKYNEKYRLIEYKYKNKQKMIWLTKTENNLFYILKDEQVHTYSELIKAMYEVEDNKFYVKNVRTNIKRLNDKLKYLGTVKSIRGIGYKLKIDN